MTKASRSSDGAAPNLPMLRKSAAGPTRRISAVLLRLLVYVCLPLATSAAMAEEPPDLFTCRRLVTERPEDWRSFLCALRFARTTGRSGDAERLLRQAVAGDPANPHAQYYLGQILADSLRDEAETWMSSAAELYSHLGNRTAEAMVRISVVFVLVNKGRLAEATEEHRRLLAAAEASGAKGLLLAAHIEEARLAIAAGDYGRAERRLRELETDVFSENNALLQSAWLGQLGLTAWGTGRSEEAFETFHRQAELLAQAGETFDEAVARGNMALIAHRDLGLDVAEGRRLAREAVEVADRSGNLPIRATARVQLARLVDDEAARTLAQEALALLRSPVTLREMAWVLRRSDPAAALALAREALELSDESWHRAEEAATLHQLAILRWLDGDREEAISYSLAALASLEELRASQTRDVARIRSFAQWADAFQILAGHLLSGDLRPGNEPEPEDLDLAHLVLERYRARDLLDLLAEERASVRSDPQVRELRREISRAQRRLLRPHLSPGERRVLEQDLAVLERQEEGVRAVGLEPAPPTNVVSAPEIRALLGPDEAVLSFQIAPSHYRYGFAGGSWVLAMTQDETRVFGLDDADRLQTATDLYLGLIESDDEILEHRAAHHLYERLLAPALDSLGAEVRRLIIAPDGFLHLMPFAALVEENRAGLDFELELTPSLSTWAHIRRRPASRTARPGLVFADPTAATRLSPATATVVGPRSGGRFGGLGALPQARREAKVVSRACGRGTRVLIGLEASEAMLRETNFSRYSLLHFATHALVDERRPGRSAVVLAPGAADEDGLLQGREIRDLDFDGQVVVLASCRSAAGPVLGGEGVMGLSRAFLAAGADAVVGTLWPLREDDAVSFFSSFYRYLAHGEGVATSVAAAQRQAMAEGRPTSAWAGVVVHGDGSRAPIVPRPLPWEGIGLGVTILAALALIASMLRIRHRRHTVL